LSGDEQSAFIEMAAASGLELVAPSQRNPLKTTSWGTGELIRHALDAGVKHILLALAAARPMTAAPGWCRRWGRSCWTTMNSNWAGRGELENWRVST
jgi:glycerate kinase